MQERREHDRLEQFDETTLGDGNLGRTTIQRPADDVEGGDLRFSYEYAAIPCEIVQGRPLTDLELRRTFVEGDATGCDTGDRGVERFPDKRVWLAMLFSMFLHGDLLHLGSNMLFLWVFGNNIEDRMGWLPYLLFYLVAGVVATLAHVAVQPASTVPLIGASGAVAGVMGAYMVLFPNVQIRSLLIFILVLIRDIPAKWLLGFWFVFQFFTNPAEGVAWVAHVGGFVFGALVAFLLRDRLLPARDPQPHPQPQF